MTQTKADMMWIRHCKHCDKEFKTDRQHSSVCPDCRKNKLIEAQKRAHARKRLKAKGWKRLSDNMVAIRLKANEAFASGLSYGQAHAKELIREVRKGGETESGGE